MIKHDVPLVLADVEPGVGDYRGPADDLAPSARGGAHQVLVFLPESIPGVRAHALESDTDDFVVEQFRGEVVDDGGDRIVATETRIKRVWRRIGHGFYSNC